MNKHLISLTISAVLASGAAFAQDGETDESKELDTVTVEGTDTGERKARLRNYYGPQFKEDDTSQLRSEPCPDYFDTDWGLVNQPGDPCWNAYISTVGEDNIPRAVREKQAEARAAAQTEPQPERPQVAQSTPEPQPTRPEPVAVTEEDCDEEDLSHQAVADNRYREALNVRESGDKDPISSDFDPSQNTAKSIAQLRDGDIEQSHLDNTFAALDDDSSGAINRIEALGVRGLADEFDHIDYNGDGVVSEAEFNLHFDGRLAGGEFICLDGERVTNLSELKDRRVSMR